MYNLILVNLTADARAVSPQNHVEQRNVSAEALRALLVNFCEIDPIENSAGDTEIRVNVRHEKYLLRTEQRKVILYDVAQRDLPAQILSVDQAMVELDGTAAAARLEAVQLARNLTTAPFLMATETVVPVTPAPQASRPRVVVLVTLAVLLLAGIIWLALPPESDRATPPGFVPVAASESESVQASLIGVYLTGREPGQHGIVITGPGEMKLVELATIDAPRMLYASYRAGRIEAKLYLATDQPGGVMAVSADGNSIVYGGETYQRIP